MIVEDIALQNVDLLEELSIRADREGCSYVRQTMDEWNAGSFRFNKTGERLLGMFDNSVCIGLAGICIDPHLGNPSIGRLRRVFVSPEMRRVGVAEKLVRVLLAKSNVHFERIRLIAKDKRSSALYEKLGFVPVEEENATHSINKTPNAG